MTLDLDKLKATIAAATPGPWKSNDHAWSPWIHREHPDIVGVVQEYVFKCGSREDAEFVMAARSAMPLLIAEIERLRAELAEARRERDAFSYGTLTRERNQLAQDIKEQADDMLGLQEIAPPADLLARICKQAHEWRIRLSNVQLRLDAADIPEDQSVPRWRLESDRVDALAAEATRLRALVVEACDLGDAACVCTSERGRTTTDGYRSRLADIRRRAEAGGKP